MAVSDTLGGHAIVALTEALEYTKYILWVVDEASNKVFNIFQHFQLKGRWTLSYVILANYLET